MSAFSDFVADALCEWILPGAIVLIIVALVTVLPWAVYQNYKSPTFDLRKDEWQCTASVERATTIFIQSGNVLVPQTTYHKHCTQWSERP